MFTTKYLLSLGRLTLTARMLGHSCADTFQSGPRCSAVPDDVRSTGAQNPRYDLGMTFILGSWIFSKIWRFPEMDGTPDLMVLSGKIPSIKMDGILVWAWDRDASDRLRKRAWISCAAERPWRRRKPRRWDGSRSGSTPGAWWMCYLLVKSYGKPVLVGGLEHFLFSQILGIIIPID